MGSGWDGAPYRDRRGWLHDRQARIHADVQSAVLSALIAGPTTVGVRDRREIGKGLFTVHVTRNGRKGRHFVLFRVKPNARQVEVLRLLHDAMDLRLHTTDT